MMEWIVTSSAMILIVIALRGLLKGKISLKLQYGLWALVLVRLLLPFSIVDSAISISNILSAPVIREADTAVSDYRSSYESLRDEYNQKSESVTDEEIRLQVQQELYDHAYTKLEQEYSHSGATVPQTQIQAEAQQQVQVISLTAVITEALPYLWVVGMVVASAVLIGSNIHFWWKLRQNRTALDIPGVPLKVYLTDYVATPCLFGLEKPDIYLTNEVMTDSQMRRHVLAHEMSHYRQGDHLWSVMRSLCLVLHWYNPLVWAAAILSKQDAELACDEATIKALGENERTAYGRTLIGMTCVRRDPRSLMLTATTMLGTKKTLKERIALIAKKPKTALYTLIACVLVAAIAVGCTFTGAPAQKEEEKLLDRCREAVEYIQTLEHFEITEHYEVVEESDYAVGPDTQDARYVHSGDDWYHFKSYVDWTWQFLEKDGQQYRKDITNAVPEEDIPAIEWTKVDLSENYYAKHAWIMDIHWDEESIGYLTYTGNGDGYEGGALTPQSVSSVTEGSAEFISVVLKSGAEETVNDIEQGALWILTFRFDLYSSEVIEVKREIVIEDAEQYVAGINGGTVEVDIISTNTLTIYPGTEEEMSAIIDGIYFDEIITVDPTPEDPTEPPVSEPTEIPTEPPTEPITEPTTEPSVPLSLEEQFQQMLTSENGYWYWRAMCCVFEKPEDIDMSHLCYVGMENGQHSSTFTDDEIAFLKMQDIGVAGDESAWSNAHKLPREELNSVLQNHFDIGLDDVTIPESWVYYSETDAYYDVRYDAYVLVGYTVTDVVINDSLVYVYWTAPFGLRDTRSDNEIVFLENVQMLLVLEELENGGYLIHMNMPVEELLQPTEPLGEPTVDPMTGILEILFSAEKLEADVKVGDEAKSTYGVSAEMKQPLLDLLSGYDRRRVDSNDFAQSNAVLEIYRLTVRDGIHFIDYRFQLRAIEDGEFLLRWDYHNAPEYYILTPRDGGNSLRDLIGFISEYFPSYYLPGSKR